MGRQFCYGVLRRVRLTGGTPGYVAPEILSAQRGCDAEVCPSEKVDIFACGVIFLELLLTPFRTVMERGEVLGRFRSEVALNKVPDVIGSRLPKTTSLLREMAEPDPAVRLSAEEVCKRFEKEVRKELCRSSTKLCCEPEPPRAALRRQEQPSVQPGREEAKSGSGGGGEARGGGGHRRKGGKRPGRKGG